MPIHVLKELGRWKMVRMVDHYAYLIPFVDNVAIGVSDDMGFWNNVDTNILVKIKSPSRINC